MNRKAELAARRRSLSWPVGWRDRAGLWPGNAGRSHDCCVMVTRMPLAAADGCCWTSMAEAGGRVRRPRPAPFAGYIESLTTSLVAQPLRGCHLPGSIRPLGREIR